MSSRTTPLIVVLLVLAAACGAIYLGMRLPVQRQPAQPPAEQPSEKPQALDVQGAEIEQRDASGKLQWKVSAAGKIEFDKDRGLARGRDVKFEMSQQGQPQVIVQAPLFEADYKSGKLTFDKGVSGRMSDGSAQFEVSRLEYQLDTRKLVGWGGARFVHGSYQATAAEMVVDARNKKVRLRGGVRFTRQG